MRAAAGVFIFALVFLFSSTSTGQASRSTPVLQAINVQDIPKWSTPFEFRVASFSQTETAAGSGAVLLVMSQDQRKIFVNLKGVTTELTSVNKNLSSSCGKGEIRQNVYSNGQVRLLLKMSLVPSADDCQANGLLSIHIDKHTHRYLVKSLLPL